MVQETIRTPESCDLRNNTYFSEVGRAALQQFLAQSKGIGGGKSENR